MNSFKKKTLSALIFIWFIKIKEKKLKEQIFLYIDLLLLYINALAA